MLFWFVQYALPNVLNYGSGFSKRRVDHEARAKPGGWKRHRQPGAYNHTARHVVERAD